ncbi:MAG: WYL domain-containing protein [Candidatus Margulisbacteria bacterium]|nr:WYL domain-containing protein [Candidatus Margulisiibacteriota bacterium]
MVNESYLRILEIDKLLRASTFPNCQTLQHFFNVSDRTILRDIDFMKKSFKAPLRYSKSKNGYYYHQEFKLEDISLTEGDLVSLLLGRVVLENYKDTPYFAIIEGAFKKISSVLDEKIDFSSSTFSMDLKLADKINVDKRYFSRLRTIALAIEDRKMLSIVHLDHASTKKSVRLNVKPLKLTFMFGEWFLIALDEKDNEAKYALDKLVELRILKKGFDVEQKQEALSINQPSLKVVVRFAKELAEFVAEKVSGQSSDVTIDDKGRALLTFTSNDIEGTYRWLLSFGSQAEILEPMDIRRRMRKNLLNMISMY